MNWPKTSIVVLNWNNYQDTRECLKSLLDLSYPNYEVIVIDNNSTDDSFNQLKNEFENFIFKKNQKNLGYSDGNNVGIKMALKNNSEYIVILNNDIVVTKFFLEPLVREAKKNEKIGLLNPLICDYNNPNYIQNIGRKMNIWLDKWPGVYSNELIKNINGKKNIDIDSVQGAAYLLKASIVKKVGFLDSDYFLIREENDLSFRVKESGYIIKGIPKSKVYHKINSTFKRKTPIRTYYTFRNKIIFMRKHAKWYHWFTFLFVYIKSVINISLLNPIKKRDQISIENGKAAFIGMIDGILNKKGKKEFYH